MSYIDLPHVSAESCHREMPSTIFLVLGFGIAFGQLIAFGPQILNIVVKKHVEGINLLTYLLGTISCTASFLSGIVESWDRFFCCAKVGSLKCFVSMQTFIQVAINWFCYFMIFLMLAIYVKNTEHKPMAKFQFRLSMTIYLLWGVIGGLAITFVYLLALGGPNSEQTNVTARYNQVLGTIGIVTIVLQWSPQIVTTFLHRGPGALSWITLSINAPGACATAVSQIASGATFAIWLPYLLSGLQQFIIVGLIIFFCVLNRRKKIKDVIDEDPGFQGPALLLHDDDDESAPLNTRASYSLDTQSPFSASSPSSSINRAFSDSEYSTSITEDEELGEEDDDSSDPTAALIRRRNKRGLPTRRLQDSSVSQSVPGYSSLLPTE